jgi:hypothetical protein
MQPGMTLPVDENFVFVDGNHMITRRQFEKLSEYTTSMMQEAVYLFCNYPKWNKWNEQEQATGNGDFLLEKWVNSVNESQEKFHFLAPSIHAARDKFMKILRHADKN